MRRSHRESRCSVERQVVCLALIVLALYNPFFTIYGSSQAPTVQHPLSLRATVAASELRRCTLDSGQSLLATLTAILSDQVTEALFVAEIRFPPSNYSQPASQVFANALWFRPPPLL
jgi:hypothetical protein